MLFVSRRFLPLFIVQALGAFNDNAYKAAALVIFTYHWPASYPLTSQEMVALAAAIFIAPFFLFSAFAGRLADAYSKTRLIHLFKCTECLLMLAASVAFLNQHSVLLLLLLFGMGTQSAFFGPIKYSIVPELIERKQLLTANGWIEAGTFLAILTGTIGGTSLMGVDNAAWLISGLLCALAAIGLVAAFCLPATHVATRNQRESFLSAWHVLTATWLVVRAIYAQRKVYMAIIGISWFWVLGSLFVTQLPLFTQSYLQGSPHMVSVLLGCFSLGIIIGSLAITQLKRHIHWLLPCTMLAISVCVIGLSLLSFPHAPYPLTALFQHPETQLLLLCLLGVAVAGGMFVVPLYTQLQLASSNENRAQNIAGNNIFNAAAVTLTSVLAAALFSHGLSVTGVWTCFALGNLPIAYLMWKFRNKWGE